jgi:hypothetical protein
MEVCQACIASLKLVCPGLQEQSVCLQRAFSGRLDSATGPTSAFEKLIHDIAQDPSRPFKPLSGLEVLHIVANDDSHTNSDGGSNHGGHSRASTPAASPAKSDKTGGGKSDHFYDCEDINVGHSCGHDDSSAETASNKHGKRTFEGIDKPQDIGFADRMKKLKVAENTHEDTIQAKPMSRKVQRNPSKPTLAESQDDHAYEAELMATRWTKIEQE